MKTAFLASAAIAALLVTSANAQSVAFGGDVSASYVSRNYGGGGEDRYQFNGSVVAGFGAFGAQVDLGTQSYADGDGFDNLTYAIHAFYAVNPALTIGAYFGVDDWAAGSSDDEYFGIEAKFTPGGSASRIEVEAFVGWYEGVFSDYGANLIGLSGSYAITDNIDLFGGYLMGNWGTSGNRDNSYDVLTAGAAYNFDTGLYVAAAYQSYVYPGSSGDYTLQLQVGYQFGGGQVFGGRSYYTLYPGD